MKLPVILTLTILSLLAISSGASVEDDIVVIKQHWLASNRPVPTDLILEKRIGT